jgi:hypothetical protein
MNEKNSTRIPTSLEKFMMYNDDGVFYIGHASALVRIKKQLFLFDPVWDHKPYGDYWTFYPKQVNCDQILEKVGNIFLSHIHEDHICDRILKNFGGSAHIMKGRPPLTKRIMATGAAAILHTPFKWTEIEDGIEAYFVPHTFNSIDSSVFLRSVPDYVEDFFVYVGSDNFLSPELIKKIKPDIPKVDVAMIPYAFIHWYPHLIVNMAPNEKNAELTRLNKQSLDQARSFIEAFRPGTVIPFGSNLYYASGEDHILNQALTKPEELVENPMKTGSFILSCGARHDVKLEEKFEATEFPVPDFDYDFQNSDLKKVETKLEACAAKVPGNVLLVNDISIDLETLKVGYKEVPKGKNATAFRFDEPIFEKWLRGEITFEQAIGTRRFICARVPNVYNVNVFEFMNNHL